MGRSLEKELSLKLPHYDMNLHFVLELCQNNFVY